MRQYNAYEPFPGLHLNGELTLGENIADLAGLAAAYDAYRASLNGRPAPVIDGLTGDQRFFLGFAQSRREQDARRSLAQPDRHRRPRPGPISRRDGPEYRRLVHRVQRARRASGCIWRRRTGCRIW